MNSILPDQTERDTHRLETSRNELAELIARNQREDGFTMKLKGLLLFRESAPGDSIHSVYNPSLCVVAQGSKEFFLGRERYVYDPAHYLLVTAELPLVGHVIEATKEQPYLSLRLELDPALVSTVMIEAAEISPKQPVDAKAMHVGSLDADLLGAVVRLVRLVEVPAEAPFLAPLITREIIYRLWMGEQHDRLLHITAVGGYTPHIAKAIELLNQGLDQPLRIEHIAHELGMSVSGFHHHFKSVTAMSPLQYQKRLRLQEARRLMLGEGLDATSAAFRVGYSDASHFNREYKSLFGLPPMRDVERLRGDTSQGIGA
ncbi:MAG: AraC family transcriptional regulator [Anaerolineales bacterium]|nr:AraC family transcriptional regulator [Anaerolineales bacterium]